MMEFSGSAHVDTKFEGQSKNYLDNIKIFSKGDGSYDCLASNYNLLPFTESFVDRQLTFKI